MNFNALPLINALSDCIHVVEKDAIKILMIKHPKANAAISLFGGHVLSFVPHPTDKQNEVDLLWMSDNTCFDGQTPLRGGVPICWPWFGKLASPSHGFARTSQWSLVEHRENEQGVLVRLGLESDASTLAIWPYQFRLQLDVHISDTLNIELTIINTDNKAWTFSGALHSYFHVGDISQTQIQGMGATYLDSLNQGKKCTGGDSLNFNAGVDRVYTEPRPLIEVTDKANTRLIHIENKGDNSAVIWNPWELSRTMKDMSDEGYQTMVCVESTWHADSLESGLRLNAGESHILSTKISVKSL